MVGNASGSDLRRDASGHDAIIMDADAVAAIKAASVVGEYQNFLVCAVVTDQKPAALDLYNGRDHSGVLDIHEITSHTV